MTDFLIAGFGVVVGWLLRAVRFPVPPADHFDVLTDVTEPVSNVVVRD